MDKKEYKKLVNNMTPKNNRMDNSIKAFLSGGLMGAFFEIINIILTNYLNYSKLDSTSIIIFTIILITCILTSFFDFDKYVLKYQAGLFIPISGFAHSIQSSMLDYKKEGFITGIGSNTFKLAGSVLLYGMTSSFILSILKVIIYG